MSKKFCTFLLLFLFFLLPIGLSTVEPLSVYLTWKEDPTSTISIRWITQKETLGITKEDNEEPIEKSECTVTYRKSTEGTWHTKEGKATAFPGTDHLVHACEIGSLEAGTEYEFFIGSSKEKCHRFVTMPKDLTTPITFVEGGDTSPQGINPFIQTAMQAAHTEPYFALLGGDLAYSVNKKTIGGETRLRWIQWLTAYYETMVTPSGRMIPLIATIGNRDIAGKYRQEKEAAACFYALFPMPGYPSYNVLRFGSYLSIYLLDSGHTSSIDGEQKEWLERELKKEEPNTRLIVAYHVPAYPSVRPYRSPMSSSIRRHWIPLFDKYHVHLVFEHHEHSYKRTHPLTHNEYDPKGTIYVGDGAWGAKPREPKNAMRTTYLAKTACQSHFIKVQLSKNKGDTVYPVQCWAISDKGIVFDHFTMPARE